MNTASSTGRFAVLPEAPYVGMRPFERSERKIFCGREAEVALLTNKVFAARITVMYGPSGVGKSSLIRTLLLDNIEKQDARVIYFEDWRGDDPTASLRRRLLEAAAQLGIADADKGDPTLVHLAQLLVGFDRRTLVVILDQFEEFFTAHRAEVEPFRSQLAALAHAQGVDLRLLISLREEHLAALEPFRSSILDLFQSMFRLEPLSAADVRKAIVNPAAEFGVSYEENLVDEIIADLASDEDANAVATTPPVSANPVNAAATDLPLLQLVCQELWNHTRAAGQQVIAKSLYESLGRRRGIVSAYLARVMPTHWRRKQVTAQLMRHLAPPDGHKVALSADHLASVTELRRGVVKQELDRLASHDVRVLLTRAYESETLYELRHDSFVRVIAPWRTEVLRRARMQQWSARAASVAALMIIGIVAALWWVDRRDLQRNVYDVWQWTSQQGDAAQKFDHVASYLLFTRTGTKRFDILRSELTAHEPELPAGYGWDRSGLDAITLADLDAPITVRYSTLRPLDDKDQYTLLWRWQKQAQLLGRNWGIPVPAKIRLVPRTDFSQTHVQVVLEPNAHVAPLELELPLEEGRYVIGTDSMASVGSEFFKRFGNEWTRLDDTDANKSWFVVPRWSVPVWKASGAVVQDGTTVLAKRLADKLLENPDRLLPEAAVRVLLDRVAAKYPNTVAEARAVRGARLTGDLQELLRQGRPLTGLENTLDLLANYPEDSSADVAKRLAQELDAASPALPASLRGPHPAAPPSDKSIPRAYQEAVTWLAPIQPETRIYVGADMVKSWADPDLNVDPRVLERFNRSQEEFLRRFGVEQPSFRFYNGEQFGDEANAVRITVPDQDGDRGKTWLSDGRDNLAFAEERYRFRADFMRARQVNADFVAQALESTDELREWLASRYSLSDIKALLRGVIAPPPEEEEARWKLIRADRIGQVDVPPEHTIRHPQWLLHSLVFWTRVHPKRSTSQLVSDLRATQSGAVVGAKAGRADRQIDTPIANGIEALAAGRPNDADREFARALGIDVARATDAFVAQFARKLHDVVTAQFTADCADYRERKASRLNRLDLEQAMARKDFVSEFGNDRARQLRLCLLANTPEGWSDRHRELVAEIARVEGPPATWAPAEASWFGHEMLRSFDPTVHDRAVARRAMEYIGSAFERMPPHDALSDFRVLVNQFCQTNQPGEWCWEMMTALAKQVNRKGMLITMAGQLADTDRPRFARQALQLLEQARQPQVPLEPGLDAQKVDDFAETIEAVATFSVGKSTPLTAQQAAREEALLRKWASSSGEGAFNLAKLLRSQERFDEARAVLEDAHTRWPDSAIVDAGRLTLALMTADTQGVTRAARDAEKLIARDEDNRVKADSVWASFLASVGLLMTGAEGWESRTHEFLGTTHEYVPYVAMLLYSRMADQGSSPARKVLEHRWRWAQRDRWPVRMREGDLTAWREMLIGYYLGQVDRQTVFGELEDKQRFDKSMLRHLPMSRRALLCEAYFYDAVLARSRNDAAAAARSLHQTVEMNQQSMIEYAMARYLLARGK